MDIYEKIGTLSEKEIQEFQETLINSLENRNWCRMHGINHEKPNMDLANEKLYQEIYGTTPKFSEENFKRYSELTKGKSFSEIIEVSESVKERMTY